MKGLSLDLFAFELRAGVVEIEDNRALLQFTDEEGGPPLCWHL